MDLLINSFAELSDLISGKNTINKLNNLFQPHCKSLTAKARKNLRTVGTSRYGLIKIVEPMAIQYDGKLAKENSAEDLVMRVAYMEAIREYKMAITSLLESLDDTDKAIGHDIMIFVDKFTGNLKTARQYDGDLDEAMKVLDEYNSRFGAVMKQEDENPEKDSPDESAEPVTAP